MLADMLAMLPYDGTKVGALKPWLPMELPAPCAVPLADTGGLELQADQEQALPQEQVLPRCARPQNQDL